ncbi:MAG: tRNA pseudouridine(38-40) synthase TruA [Oleiphilus sp.]
MLAQISESNSASDDKITGRIALCVAYNGHQYYGWQAQKSGLPTIQKCLEEALSVVANEPIEVVCAGRTDKSVHASYQVVHFETKSSRTQRSWVFGCNANLPKDISVSWAVSVNDNFHARFSATSRRYNYLIYNHPVRPASFATELSWCHHPLNADDMHLAAQSLVGEHDFTSFRAVGCQSKTPFRFLEFVNVTRHGDIVLLDIKGNAFLHHMVRNIAGVLMAIGAGEQGVEWCKFVLEAKDRTQASVTAQPFGLFLTQVDYPEDFGLPKSSGAPSLVQAMIHAGETAAFCDQSMWNIAFLDK